MSEPNPSRFLAERNRTRRFFNLVSVVYPLIEGHLRPQYRDVLAQIDLPSAHPVLDLATGSGVLAGAFAERGHAVTGLDFAEQMLKRASRQYPGVAFEHFDLLHLESIASNSYDLVAMGYLLHGLTPDFRRYILRASARIAAKWVLIFDYGRAGGWFVRLIEWIEGPNYPGFLAEDRARELAGAGLRIEREGRVADFGHYWLCVPGDTSSLLKEVQAE